MFQGIYRRTARVFLASLFLLVGFDQSSAQPSAKDPARSADQTHSTQNDLVIILDASGSMWGQIDGENKIVIARRVLKKLVASLPEGTNVGLVAYGHRREGDCSDIQTVIPLGALDRDAFGATVDGLNPKGKTPITKSIEETFSTLQSHDGPVTVILVSDGLETCSGDPCAAVREARETGIELLMHVVGFDLGDADVSALQCAAETSGGRYFDARSADELSAALDEAIEVPVDTTESVIVILATANGKLVDAGVHVNDVAADTAVAFRRTYTGEATNPRYIGVRPGTYDIIVKAIALKGGVSTSFESVTVAAGDTVFKSVDFSPGILLLGITRNGALSDATVRIYRAGTKQRVAGGRTYRSETSNPKSISLTSGLYDVEVGSVEISSSPKHRWENISIAPDSTTVLRYEFQSAVIQIGVIMGSELVDAVVHLRDRASHEEIARGRTYVKETSNPKSFTLPPGDYTVHIKAVKLEGKPEREFDISVAAADSVRRMIDMSE